jgi:hypothetical protein
MWTGSKQATGLRKSNGRLLADLAEHSLRWAVWHQQMLDYNKSHQHVIDKDDLVMAEPESLAVSGFEIDGLLHEAIEWAELHPAPDAIVAKLLISQSRKTASAGARGWGLAVRAKESGRRPGTLAYAGFMVEAAELAVVVLRLNLRLRRLVWRL